MLILSSTPPARVPVSGGSSKSEEDTTPPETVNTILDNLTSSPDFTRKVVGDLKSGDKVTIVLDGQEILKIESDGPGVAQRFISASQEIITAAADEASQLVKADPAFAFKESALGVKTQVYAGLPREVQGFADKAFLPMLRTAALVLDAKKFMDTRANKDAELTDKLVDGAHVVTDVVGLVGALSPFMPFLGPVAGTLTAVGLAGDIAAYSYHVLAYLKQRGQVN